MVSVDIDSDIRDLKINGKVYFIFPLVVFGWFCHPVHLPVCSSHVHSCAIDTAVAVP